MKTIQIIYNTCLKACKEFSKYIFYDRIKAQSPYMDDDKWRFYK